MTYTERREWFKEKLYRHIAKRIDDDVMPEGLLFKSAEYKAGYKRALQELRWKVRQWR